MELCARCVSCEQYHETLYTPLKDKTQERNFRDVALSGTSICVV